MRNSRCQVQTLSKLSLFKVKVTSISDLFRADMHTHLGIDDFGYVENPIPDALTLNQFKRWIKENDHYPLSYLSDEQALKRADLKKCFPKFQSALVFLFSYAPTFASLEHLYSQRPKTTPRIASFVLGFDGEDYHKVLKRKMAEIETNIKQIKPGIETMICLDTAPVLERDLAYRAGLGLFGKNSILLNKKLGSLFIIGSILLSEKLGPELTDLATTKKVQKGSCGDCRRCIDACPTGAIKESDRSIIAKRCISTFTIEIFKNEVPPPGYERSSGEFFGCDICQRVCPWNKSVLQSIDPAELTLIENSKEEKVKTIVNFFLLRSFSEITTDLEKMSNREFRRKFTHTALERTGRMGLLKNLRPFLTLKEVCRAEKISFD